MNTPLALLTLMALLGPGAALAQTPAAKPAPAAPGLPAVLGGDLAAATAAEDAEKPVTPQAIRLEAGRGAVLRLPEPAASVLSADPSVVRVQPAAPNRLFLTGVAVGRTTVIATNAAGATISQFEVTVQGGNAADGTRADAAGAEAAIIQAIPTARDIRVRANGRDLELSGIVLTPAAAQQAEAIAKSYTGAGGPAAGGLLGGGGGGGAAGGPAAALAALAAPGAGASGVVVNNLVVLGSIQVNVRVRFAEIQRTVTRELGFNWQALAGAGGGFQFGFLTGIGATSPLSPFSRVSQTALNGSRAAQIGLGSTRWDINGIIDALAADQLITILAEPNLTALSGETASFLAGGEFPVPVAATQTGEVTITFKQFGISLAVVPTVLAPERLNLRVRPEVSELSDNGAISVPLATGTVKIPALTVRRAETTIELGSGQSFAIAGLLQKNATQNLETVPGLGEVPVLGALFRSTAYQRAETELVIIVTPYLVKPVSTPARVRAPTDGFKDATDLDRILFGRQTARAADGAKVAAAPGATTIDAGFILR